MLVSHPPSVFGPVLFRMCSGSDGLLPTYPSPQAPDCAWQTRGRKQEKSPISHRPAAEGWGGEGRELNRGDGVGSAPV